MICSPEIKTKDKSSEETLQEEDDFGKGMIDIFRKEREDNILPYGKAPKSENMKEFLEISHRMWC